MARNYSSIYNIKDFVATKLVPKYFDTNDVSEFNLGLLGYTTEMMSTITEDNFNTVSAYMNEIFPNLATMPESIYNYGALFQLGGSIATPSQCVVYLFIAESDIIKHGIRNTSNDSWDFYLDADMIIDVDGIRFKPDYDIYINRKPNPYDNTNTSNKFIYTVSYVKEKYGEPYTNSISDISNQYIKSRVINYNGEKFLQMEVIVHNVEKFYMNENVINSDVINLPTYTIDYEGHLGNFEVFYREPSSTTFVQLKKKLLGTPGNKDEKFCYYKIIDEHRLEISFSSRDGYFYPLYNSEINIEYYTTNGEAGNFDVYTGTNINVYPESKVYDYNKNILIYGIPMTGATGGTDPITSESLKNMVIEKFSTVNSYTNENDLELFFKNLNTNQDSQIHFMKKRDDILRRSFSAYTLLKDKDNIIYDTNTLNLKLQYGFNESSGNDFDESSTNTVNVIKPGREFVYMDGSLDTLIPFDAESGVIDDRFIYSNPFLILCPKDPLTVGFYLNAINSTHSVDYEMDDMNHGALVQFISSDIRVHRNPINNTDSDKYRVSITVVPTTTLPYPMVVKDYTENENQINIAPYYDSELNTLTFSDGVEFNVENRDGVLITHSIKMTLTVYGKTRKEVKGYVNMAFDYDASDITNNGYVFYAMLETDDEVYLTADDDMILLTNLLSSDPNVDSASEPSIIERSAVQMKNVILGTTTYYTSPTGYVWTNRYLTINNPVTLIQPLDIVQGTAKYTVDAFDSNYNTTESSLLISSVPMINTQIINDYEKFMNLMSILYQQYNTLSAISKLITTNYSIDLKFYNTYGKSKNFHIIDNKENPLLDRVNIRIEFDIKTAFGVDADMFNLELKAFIKDYIENINSGGTNSIYISNMIKAIETRFSEIRYMIFRGINENDALTQGIENATTDLSTLTREERISYVPEYLTVGLDDIVINLL